MLMGIINHQDGDQVCNIFLTYIIIQLFLVCKTLCKEYSLEPTVENIDMDASGPGVRDLVCRCSLVTNQLDASDKFFFSQLMSLS